MGKKSSGESLRLIKESFDSISSVKYIDEKVRSYFMELVIDFQSIYRLDLIKELESGENIARIFILIRGLEANPQSWYFAKKNGNKRGFSHEEAILLRTFEMNIRTNTPKNKQKSLKFEYPWKDESVKKFGSKKMTIKQMDKVLERMRNSQL